MIDGLRARISRGEHATMDFETRSQCDLKKHGAWVYSKDSSTEALCLSYKLPGRPVKTWHMAHKARSPWNEDAPEHDIPESELPTDLFEWIALGGLVEAHNAFFERCIWTNVMAKRHGWPELNPIKLRCSASKASASALPRDLENAAKSMTLDVEKDMDGRALMLKMTKPRKPRKAEREAWVLYCEENDMVGTPHPVIYHETEESIYRNHEYCERDVETEKAFSAVCPDLSQRELALWQLDQEINWHGVKTDLVLAKRALERSKEAKVLLADELSDLVGEPIKPSQRGKVKEWLEKDGLELEDTKSGTLDWYLDHYEFEKSHHRRILEIIKSYNRTSIRKFQAIIDKTDPEDGRARDILMYHGASTGRWSGRGIQVQNFPRGNAADNAYYIDKKTGKEKGFFSIDLAVSEVKDESLSTEFLATIYDGDIMELLSSCLRGAILPSHPDNDLVVADYSAIEARCVLWEAGAEKALEVFRTGGDIYCDMAEGIYGYPVNKKDHPQERQFGKQAILGLGYGMGYITFLLTCRMYKISFDVEQVKKIVGDLYDKYEAWIYRSLINPTIRDGEEPEDFKARKKAAIRKRNMLMDARIDPTASIHELVLMKYTVEVYRKRYPEVPALWKQQEEAAIRALREAEECLIMELDLDGLTLLDEEGERRRETFKGPEIEAGCCTWFVENNFLCCRLPSGRLLRYRAAYVQNVKTEWGESKPAIRYYTVILGSKWGRTATYGGKIVENITQAVARDIMGDSMLVMSGHDVEANVYYVDEEINFDKYRPLMTVHDEIVGEGRKDSIDKEEFEELMCSVGPWANGCPIKAEAETMPRYRK